MRKVEVVRVEGEGGGNRWVERRRRGREGVVHIALCWIAQVNPRV